MAFLFLCDRTIVDHPSPEDQALVSLLVLRAPSQCAGAMGELHSGRWERDRKLLLWRQRMRFFPSFTPPFTGAPPPGSVPSTRRMSHPREPNLPSVSLRVLGDRWGPGAWQQETHWEAEGSPAPVGGSSQGLWLSVWPVGPLEARLPLNGMQPRLRDDLVG